MLNNKRAITRTFPKEFMVEALYGDNPDTVTMINDIEWQDRWSTYYTFVFQYEGKYYQTSYGKGSTEIQDERPWEYEDEVECVEVKPVPKTITVYEIIKEEKENGKVPEVPAN